MSSTTDDKAAEQAATAPQGEKTVPTPDQHPYDSPKHPSPTTEKPAWATPHATAEEAQHAMSATDAWKPAMNRRQSWNKEEHKHSMQMGSISDVKTGPGFSERAQ